MLAVLVIMLWLVLFLAFRPLIVASAQHRERERLRQQRWMLIGAGVAVVGLLVFFRRKKSSTVAVASEPGPPAQQ